MATTLLLGGEICALGAIDAGISAAYGYPGTPSTEIIEFLLRHGSSAGDIVAKWCANEKTSYEGAMGVSYAGKRALVSMKHVGLNVAFDSFVNSALQKINGGLVVAVGDDPGMHSSQNEQDTRCLADFAHVVCLEPGTHQEVYDMTREAFDVSEMYHIPVVIRLVTRLAHSRSAIQSRGQRPPNEKHRAHGIGDWMCIPTFARVNYHTLVERQPALREWSELSRYNTLAGNRAFTEYGVITAGLGGSYYRDVAGALPTAPPHLHIGTYPVPVMLVKKLAGMVDRIVVIEEGYPFIEEKLRSIIRDPQPLLGKMDGLLPYEGELTPDSVRKALGIPEHEGTRIIIDGLPPHPPQLCKGCPHHDTFAILRSIVDEYDDAVITSDIGCYTLGALPPYEIINSALCMGASIGMAIGAADAGYSRVIATIGDSTFLHSGLTGLVDAVASDACIVLMILDNCITAMTGGQETILDSSQLYSIVAGMGVAKDHFHVMEPLPKHHDHNVALVRRELEYRGLSVIIAKRECAKAVKQRQKGELR